MIGVFDSGSGGLTVLSEIRKRAPQADIVYFGDIKNAPYGERRPDELGALTALGIQKLIQEGATGIVSACNSVSVSIILPMFDILDIPAIPVVEMVGPTVSYFKNHPNGERILLAATPATIASGMYERGFGMIERKIRTLPIPGLAGAIEFGGSREEIREIIASALGSASDFDTLLLACTHYPFALDVFEEVIKERGVTAEIFDPASVVAERAIAAMPVNGRGHTQFLISKDSPEFRGRAATTGADYTIEVLS